MSSNSDSTINNNCTPLQRRDLVNRWKRLHLLTKSTDTYIGTTGHPVKTDTTDAALAALFQQYGNVHALYKNVKQWMDACILAYNHSYGANRWSITGRGPMYTLSGALQQIATIYSTSNYKEYLTTLQQYNEKLKKWTLMGLYKIDSSRNPFSSSRDRYVTTYHYMSGRGNWCSSSRDRIDNTLSTMYGSVDEMFVKFNAKKFMTNHTKSPEGNWYNNDRLGPDDDPATFEPKAMYAFFITVESEGTVDNPDYCPFINGSDEPNLEYKKVKFNKTYEISVDLFGKGFVDRFLGKGLVYRGNNENFGKYFARFNDVPTELVDTNLLVATNEDEDERCTSERASDMYTNYRVYHDITTVELKQIGGIDHY